MTNRCSVTEDQMRHDAECEEAGDRFERFELAVEREFENHDTLDKAVALLREALEEVEEFARDAGFGGDEDNGTYKAITGALDELGCL